VFVSEFRVFISEQRLVPEFPVSVSKRFLTSALSGGFHFRMLFEFCELYVSTIKR